MRAPAFFLLLALGLPGCLGAERRPEFFQIDQPLWLGLDGLRARLHQVRELRPVVALHLSGGSARGFAHLGVLERLEEAGIRPDLILSNSMGSFVGLLYAAGVPLDVIRDLCLNLDSTSLFTLKLPTAGGVADLRGLLSLVHALVGELDIAEAPLPVVIACEDLLSMRRVLLAEGDLVRVLRAAIALPGLFEPVEWGELTLIDGGVSNLAPMEPFWELADAHLASTAFYDRDLEPNDPFTVFNMALNNSKSRTAVVDIKEFQPFLIRCDVEQFTYMGWHQIAEIRQRGYDACAERSEELRQYLAERGVEPQAALPEERQRLADRYRERWADLKRRLSAGQHVALDRGYGALQVHPLLLKRYREPNRLEQSNYAAASYLYAGPRGAVRGGLLSDFNRRHGALLDLGADLEGGLEISLRNLFFFTLEDGEFADPALYHLLRSGWPLPVGERLALEPRLRGELRWEPAEGAWQAAAAGGVALRLAGRTRPNALGGELGLFWESPDVFGLESELLFRQRLAGPVQVLARALFRQAWSGTEALHPSYNDFFRGVTRASGQDSYAVGNFELCLAGGGLFFTLWEAFMLKDFELAAFCDALWEEAARFEGPLHPSFGASLRGTAALAGLVPLTAMLSAGWDLDAERFVLTLNLGAPF